MNRNKGESCPGEAKCSDDGGILHKYAGEPINVVCGSCRFLATKPEDVPEQVAEWMSVAVELDELRRSGATFAYPEALTLVEWAALTAHTRGQNKAEQMRPKK